jgi:hypothetical protein
MQCKECEGRRGYQPLIGPWEVCQACGGTGVSTVVPFEGPFGRFGELRFGEGVCISSAPSDGPFQLKDRLPAEEPCLAWVREPGCWVPTTATKWGFLDWKHAARLNPEEWWRPMPPPPPGV